MKCPNGNSGAFKKNLGLQVLEEFTLGLWKYTDKPSWFFPVVMSRNHVLDRFGPKG